jgi:hypothetical protein
MDYANISAAEARRLIRDGLRTLSPDLVFYVHSVLTLPDKVYHTETL